MNRVGAGGNVISYLVIAQMAVALQANHSYLSYWHREASSLSDC